MDHTQHTKNKSIWEQAQWFVPIAAIDMLPARRLQVPEHDVTAHWHDACFNHLFANQIGLARTALRSRRLRVPRGGAGHGERRMGEAARLLMLSEAGARKAAADAVVLLGLTSWNPIPVHVRPQRRALKVHQALPHRLPHDLEHPSISATATSPSRTHRTCTSVSGLSAAGLPISSSSGSSSLAYASANMSTATFAAPAHAPAPVASRSIFGRWGASASSSSASLAPSPTQEVERHEKVRSAEGAVEEMIAVGMAFGFVLFNLVFSLLLKKAQSLVGLLGFKHDRCAAGVGALQFDSSRVRYQSIWAFLLPFTRVPAPLVRDSYPASAGVDADGTGCGLHGVFCGSRSNDHPWLVLLLSGYQADEVRIIRPYKGFVDVPSKILRMSGDAQAAIAVLQRGLEALQTFLVFELAWTLLEQRRHQEAADAFVRLTELNSWYVLLVFYFSIARIVSYEAGLDKKQWAPVLAGADAKLDVICL
ncbi:hypothetical protein C8R44DRAFT_888710 [Mycena epipterygia]|nr:hypothetical protein C8R44DRAFT_888710 [Mycena epipterygia]